MKKVLIVGQYLETGRTEEVYGRGFESDGCEVKHFNWQEEDKNLRSSSILSRISWRLGWKVLAKPLNKKLLMTANKFKPDLTLVVCPKYIEPETIQLLKKHGSVFVFFTDNPLDEHHVHTNSWIKSGFPLWNAVFIWSQDLVEKLTCNGVENAYFHPFCSDIEYHFPKKPNNPLYDVAFIGNWDSSRKRERYLKAVANYNLGIWGSDYWNTHCREPNLKGLCQGLCNYQEIPVVLGSAKIGLNILRPQNEMGHNIRTFEIPACGTLMMSERSEELLSLFEEDKEAVYFSSPEELNRKVDYLLKKPELSNKISEAGLNKALEHQTKDRISHIKLAYNFVNNKISRVA